MVYGFHFEIGEVLTIFLQDIYQKNLLGRNSYIIFCGNT